MSSRRQLVAPLRSVIAANDLKHVKAQRDALRTQLVATVETLERTRRAK